MIQCEKLALIYFALFLKYYFIVFSHAIRKLLVAALNPYKYVSYKCVCTCVCLIAHSYLTLLIPWTVALQTPPLMGFPRQEYWSGFPFPSPGDIPNPGIETKSTALQVVSFIAGGFLTN